MEPELQQQEVQYWTGGVEQFDQGLGLTFPMQSPSDDGLIVTAYDEAPSQPVPKEKTWAIFVGDLSRDVDADKLKAAFSAYPSIYDAKVVMDPKTGNSRGYGFVSFLEKSEAAAAIEQMDGVLKVGKRTVRVSWGHRSVLAAMSRAGTKHSISACTAELQQTIEEVFNQSPYQNTTVYIGNIPLTITDSDLGLLFQPFGFVYDVRIQVDRGFAFVTMDTHESAVNAIVSLNGTFLDGRRVKCSWGKERPPHPDAMHQMPVLTTTAVYSTSGSPTSSYFPYGYPATALAAEAFSLEDGKEAIFVPQMQIYNPTQYVYAFPIGA